MKITILLLGCLFAFGVRAADSSKPATFAIRAVVDNTSTNAEELTCGYTSKTQEERLFVEKNALLDNSSLKKAAVEKDPITGAPLIGITFTKSGAKRFAEITRQSIGRRVAIVIDGKICTAPVVQTEIAGGKAVIAGSFSKEEATELAERLNRGATK